MKILDDLQRDWAMSSEIQKLESRLWQLAQRDGLQIVVVTSPVRGEGKSTTVAYLAAALARHTGRRILAMDFDFRHPSLTKYLDLEPEHGIADVLRGERSVGDVIMSTDIAGLDFVAVGKGPQDPGLLNNSEALATIFETVRPLYGLVIVDAPAFIPVSDASTLIPHSDGVVLVAMAGRTTKPHLSRTRELCLGLGAKILGLVVGNVQEAAPGYLDSSYYDRAG